MAGVAEKLTVNREVAQPAPSRFARRHAANGDGNLLRAGWAAPDRATNADDARALGLSIFQFIGSSLEGGPRGIHPPTYIAALAAIAGYAARHVVSIKVAHHQLPDDFNHVNVTRSKTIIVSEQVNDLVVAMDRPSIASIAVATALRCGLTRVPDVNALLQRHLGDPDTAAAIAADHRPDVPAETLLMMYWEQVARFFRTMSGDLAQAPLAGAHAVGEAISVYRDKIPVEKSLQIALATSIAMSKVDRAF